MIKGCYVMSSCGGVSQTERCYQTLWRGIVAGNLTCKFDMELILRLEYLHIKGTVWSKVLHRPGSQDGLMILTGNKDKAFSFLHFLNNVLLLFSNGFQG